MEHSVKITTLLGYSITVSIGVTTYEQDDSIDDFIARADRAMYEAKNVGKDRVIRP